jgi:hypothetical protein
MRQALNIQIGTRNGGKQQNRKQKEIHQSFNLRPHRTVESRKATQQVTAQDE